MKAKPLYDLIATAAAVLCISRRQRDPAMLKAWMRHTLTKRERKLVRQFLSHVRASEDAFTHHTLRPPVKPRDIARN